MSPKWQSKTLLHGVHAFVGGSGTPIILLPGWPETADAYAEIFPYLSNHYQVWVLDPPGLGESARSSAGYDTMTISKLLKEAIDAAVQEPYHLVGHDIGTWIAYAWASQFPASLRSLTLLDAMIAGLGPPLSYPLSHATNMRLFQFSFNNLPDLPEMLTQGREKQFLDWLFDTKSMHPERITQAKRNRYVKCYSKPGAMSQGFAYYRAVAASSSKHVELAETKLAMPVLALGGAGAIGENLKISMEALAHDVQGGQIDDCGHYVMEEQPEAVSRRLLEFFQQVDEKTS